MPDPAYMRGWGADSSKCSSASRGIWHVRLDDASFETGSAAQDDRRRSADRPAPESESEGDHGPHKGDVHLRPVKLSRHSSAAEYGEICKPNIEQEAQLWAARVFNVLAAEKSLPDLVRQQKA
jgi:hypothetical protein